MGTNENSCSISCFSYLPIDFVDHGQITPKLKEEEFLFLPTFKCLFFDRKLKLALWPSGNSSACHAGDRQGSVPRAGDLSLCVCMCVCFVIKNCN